MNNVFKDFEVGMRYDLKGSSQGRNLLKSHENLNDWSKKYNKTALKDNDFLRL